MSSSSSAGAATASSLLKRFENVPRYAIYNSIYETIGRTPIVKLNNMTKTLKLKNGVNVYVKLESENPGGSIKGMIPRDVQ